MLEGDFLQVRGIYKTASWSPDINSEEQGRDQRGPPATGQSPPGPGRTWQRLGSGGGPCTGPGLGRSPEVFLSLRLLIIAFISCILAKVINNLL